MDKDLERIMNMSKEERDKVNKKIDKKSLTKRGHLTKCEIVITKASTQAERVEKERINMCMDRRMKKKKFYRSYGGE